MLNQEVLYEADPSRCFTILRDDILPTVTVAVVNKLAGFSTVSRTFRCRVNDEDINNLTLGVRLAGRGGIVEQPPEFRVYCKPDGEGGAIVWVGRRSKAAFGLAPVNSVSSLVARTFTGITEFIPGGTAYLRASTIEVDGELATTAEHRDYPERLVDAMVRSAARQIHAGLGKSLARAEARAAGRSAVT